MSELHRLSLMSGVTTTANVSIIMFLFSSESQHILIRPRLRRSTDDDSLNVLYDLWTGVRRTGPSGLGKDHNLG